MDVKRACRGLRPFENKTKTVEIVNIAVKESMQNNGIGRKLIEEAVNKAKQMGAATIEIGTGNSSIGQLALYQKCGFRLQAIDHDFSSGIMKRRFSKTGYSAGI